MKKRVILFFPELLKHQRPLLVPLELLSLSSVLKEMDLDVRIMDERLVPWTPATLESHLQNVLVVGISCRPGGQVKRAFQFARAVKDINPDIVVVMGGWFPSVVHERTANHPAVDFVVVGEGELPFKQLIEHLQTNRSPQGIPGVGSMINGRYEYVQYSLASQIESNPMPDYSAIDLEQYLGDPRELSYISSKGCDNTCQFCAITCGYNEQWYPLPAERVVAEISQLTQQWQLEKIRFVDANFFADEHRVAAICQGFLKADLRLTWQAPGRIDQLLAYSDETWNLIQQSGCQSIETGVESGSFRVLDRMKKHILPCQAMKLAETLADHNISGCYNFILGYPGESMEDVKDTIQATLTLRSRYPDSQFAIYRYSPIPITGQYQSICGTVPGSDDPLTVEDFQIYRLTRSQTWLPDDQAKLIDMLFYYYLPFSLRSPDPAPDSLAQRVKNILIYLARRRVQAFNFHYPFEWWLLRIGSRCNLLNPQRFRQWAQS